MTRSITDGVRRGHALGLILGRPDSGSNQRSWRMGRLPGGVPGRLDGADAARRGGAVGRGPGACRGELIST